MNIGINMGAILETAKMDRLGLVLQTMVNVFDETSKEKMPGRNELELGVERGLMSAFSSVGSFKVEIQASTRVTSDMYCLTTQVRIPALGSLITAVVERKLANGVTGRTTSISIREDITG